MKILSTKFRFLENCLLLNRFLINYVYDSKSCSLTSVNDFASLQIEISFFISS